MEVKFRLTVFFTLFSFQSHLSLVLQLTNSTFKELKGFKRFRILLHVYNGPGEGLGTLPGHVHSPRPRIPSNRSTFYTETNSVRVTFPMVTEKRNIEELYISYVFRLPTCLTFSCMCVYA